MRGYDFTPYRRSTVGFDRLFDFLESAGRAEQENYPPFDIEKLGDDSYRITLAVAGFKREEIEIVAHQNMLTITGRRGEDRGRDGSFLHMGIANRVVRAPLRARRFRPRDRRRPQGRPALDRARPRDPGGDEAAQDRDRRRRPGDDRGRARRLRTRRSRRPRTPKPPMNRRRIRSGAGIFVAGFVRLVR